MTATKVSANPQIVLREEFDDWAILFDPDTGNTFGLNPLGVLVWRLLDGRHTVAEIAAAVREKDADVPDEVEGHIEAFVQNARRLGLVTQEDQ